MFEEISREMIDFIKQNPTAFHTVNTVKTILKENGFTELSETQTWFLEKSKKYYVTRNSSSIIAFTVPKNTTNLKFNIASSHTDSPSFKLKENAELKVNNEYVKLNVEPYGGMIDSTWLDKALSIAGRIFIKTSDGIKAKLINFDRDLVLIPNVAIHMNREVNDGYKFNNQVDMLPLFACENKDASIKSLIAKEEKIKEEDIVSCELFLYNRQQGSIWGCDNEFVSSSRLDDQQCVFSSLKGFLEAENNNAITVLSCFDNEEVGSGTKQGADSTFLYDTLKRISLSLGKTEQDFLVSLSSSFMLSSDNAHAVHPNHPELTDANNNAYLNKGIVLKTHAEQKYTTDALSSAIVKMLASKNNIPLQYFSNRSDKRSGSTLGNISTSHVSINCADIGIAQLAMHSSYETCGIKDTYYMICLMKAMFESDISFNDSENISIN